MSSYVSYDHLKVIVSPGDPIMQEWENYYGPELLAGGMQVLPFAIEEFYPHTQATEWELAIVRLIIGCGNSSDGPATSFDPREFAQRFRLSLRQIRRKLKVMEEKGLLKTTPYYDEKGKKTRRKIYDCNPFLDKVFAAMCADDEWRRQQLALVDGDEDINDLNDATPPVADIISVPQTPGTLMSSDVAVMAGTSMSSDVAIMAGTSMSPESEMTARTSMSPENPALSTEISTSYVRALGSNSLSNSSNINININILKSNSISNSNDQTLKNLDAENDDTRLESICSSQQYDVDDACLPVDHEEVKPTYRQDDDAARFERWVKGTIEQIHEQEQEQEQQESQQGRSHVVACSTTVGQEISSREAVEQAVQIEQATEQECSDAPQDDLPVILQGRSRAALHHISNDLHDAYPHSSRTRARTLYNHLLRINQHDDEYTMSDPDLYFADLMLTVKHHISDKTFRCKDGHGQPNGMPLFFHELKKRVEDQVSSVEEMRQQGDYLRMYHERQQISSEQAGSAPSTVRGQEVCTAFMREQRASQQVDQLVLTNAQIVEHAQRLQLPMTAEEAQDILSGTAPELLIEQITCAVRLGLYYELIDSETFQ